MGRLLVSVRGPNEALAAAAGGAHITDIEYPASALGTPYPLNIKAVRDSLNDAGYSQMPLSTNIGEEQRDRASACQAALGVAIAGADYVKCGLAGLSDKSAAYLGRNIVRTVREWRPSARIYPAVFPEPEFAELLDPLNDGLALVDAIGCDGLLIDTFNKNIGMGLLDYYPVTLIEKFVAGLHEMGKEAWVAGSITKDELPDLWSTGVDVICVRGAACSDSGTSGRFGKVTAEKVASLLPD